jgi:hypothetical protein|tara:strand:+ start:424 stop:1431 length:1008 start_codon:yes stop_codon:yes gene_type:complete
VSEFIHNQTAHCENGVTLSLLKNQGLEFMTEPLAFGIGSGLFYIHIPFMKVNNGPAISFRTIPGLIFRRTCKLLGVHMVTRKFRSHEEAQSVLEDLLKKGIPVGCQVGVYHLVYFPKEYRFHFNAHNLIVFGKEEGRYLISDPTMEMTTSLLPEELDKVRFAKGAFAPKGRVNYVLSAKDVTNEKLKSAIKKGISRNCQFMLKIPGGIAGAKGINYTAKQIEGWREKYGEKQAALHLGQIVRMQEEIGTGGGGFRFLYAAFLDQASEIFGNDQLLKISDKITQSGDLWRDSAMQMSGIYKGRLNTQKDYLDTANLLREISALEKEAFQELKRIKL